MKGLEKEDKTVRHNMLNYNMSAVVKLMKESGYDNPVGFIVDTSDKYGSIMAKIYMEKEGIDYNQHLDDCTDKKMIPTLVAVLPLDFAKQLMQITSSDAAKTMSTPLQENIYWIVCIARGGNTYAGVKLTNLKSVV